MVDRNIFGDGFMINVKNHLQFSMRNDLNSPDFQIMWVEIHFIKCKFLTGVMYRPHKFKTDKLY